MSFDRVPPSLIQAMASPFRYNKKQRKRYKRLAKAEMKVANKFADAGRILRPWLTCDGWLTSTLK